MGAGASTGAVPGTQAWREALHAGEPPEWTRLGAAFAELDPDGTGVLSREQTTTVLATTACPLSEEQVVALTKRLMAHHPGDPDVRWVYHPHLVAFLETGEERPLPWCSVVAPVPVSASDPVPALASEPVPASVPASGAGSGAASDSPSVSAEEAPVEKSEAPVEKDEAAVEKTTEEAAPVEEAEDEDTVWLASRRGDVTAALSLVGVDILRPDDSNNTPLYYASLCGHAELVFRFLEVHRDHAESSAIPEEEMLRCKTNALNAETKEVLAGRPWKAEKAEASAQAALDDPSAASLFGDAESCY